MQPNYAQYGPPPGVPQYQYAPPATMYGQPPQPQYGAAPVDSGPIVAADPMGGGGGDGPLPRHLIGCAVAFVPTAHDPHATFNSPQGPIAKPSVTYDLYVLAGPHGAPHVEYGDSQEHGKPMQPNCWRSPTPGWWDGIMCSNKGIVKELAPYAGTNRPVIARVEMGSRGGFILGRVEPGEREALIDLIGRHRRGEWRPSDPTPINGGPRPPAGAPAAQQQYGTPPGYAAGYAPVQGAPYGQQPAMQQQYAPPAGYAAPAGYPPPPGNPYGGQISYAGVPVQAPPPAPAPAQQSAPPQGGQGDIPPAPPQFDPALWASLTPAQRAPFLA